MPNMYTLKTADKNASISKAVAGEMIKSFTSLKKVAEKEKIKAFLDDIQSLTTIFSKQIKSHEGWSIFPNPFVVVEYFGKDEFKYDERKTNDFYEQNVCNFDIVGYFIV